MQAKPAFWFSAPAGARCRFQSADTAVTNNGVRVKNGFDETSCRARRPLFSKAVSSFPKRKLNLRFGFRKKSPEAP